MRGKPSTQKLQRPLTTAQERFACALAEGKRQSEAYREAYPHSVRWKQDSVHSKSSQLASHPQVKERVRELLDGAAERAEMTAADVLREAMRLARFDIRKLYRPDGTLKPIIELDDETAAAIQAVDVHEEWSGVGKRRKVTAHTKKYRIADKVAALEKLFKHFGLYEKDNGQLANPLRELAAALSGKVVGAVAEVPAGPGEVIGVGRAGLDDDGDD
jgi:phage terminase small subunit